MPSCRVAEDVFTPITTLYGFTPDEKINFIIRDHDDYSNGAAYYYDNKIEIWASSMDFELRGSHNWLRNVVAHEFTHMIQLQSARKFSKNVPAMYLQWIGYEKEARPDVLYGYPNTIVSYPIAFTVIPSWFAEGVSQYQIPGLKCCARLCWKIKCSRLTRWAVSARTASVMSALITRAILLSLFLPGTTVWMSCAGSAWP